MILPIFAFANAGIDLHGVNWNSCCTPVPLGVMAGLFVGKQVGCSCSAGLRSLGFASLPRGVGWRWVCMARHCCAVWDSMSLFIGSLAFENAGQVMFDERIGIVLGSLISGWPAIWCSKRLATVLQQVAAVNQPRMLTRGLSADARKNTYGVE